MPTLHLSQRLLDSNRHRVELALETDDSPRQTAVSEFSFTLTDQEQEDLRWYLEDFLTYPLDPSPAIAERIECDMDRIGNTLFDGVFSAEDARDLWATVRPDLGDTRIEISTDIASPTIPWELLRDPKTEMRLALRAHSFVRTHSNPAQRPKLPDKSEGPIHILLAICRPGGSQDVPFRSVASRLLRGLSDTARESFQLDILRPPTYARLAEALRDAKSRNEPYHILHFDGHGTFGDVSSEDPATLLRTRREGAHGYLVFENPTAEENRQFVGGPTLGKLLVETGTPLLILNACRSAYAEPSDHPQDTASASPHAEVRTFGSLAQEVMDTGVAGVVANRYNIYIETAARFIGELYARLVSGDSLGEAVSLGRKQLDAEPQRTIAYEPRPLQDWQVPVVYEAAPVALFSKREKKLSITLGDAAEKGSLDHDLPARPDAGFYGRDETLLALDRAFDTQPIVLLHAFAGSGKTATAAEFARWYALTGGLDGPVLFTSFEHHKPLARVLDHFGQVFDKALEGKGIQWLTLKDYQCRDVALQIMRQVQVLWIWDNVEQVAGFPRGTTSAWTDAEQQELADFLRAARATQARFLLTSRRDERDWLGHDLPARITLPPMPAQEMLELTRALADKQQRRITDVKDWRPLLDFTQGNPLTLTVLVGQALRAGLRDRTHVDAFVDRLRAGETVFEDETSEGRTKSLGASLSYGFEHAFSEAERKQLAVLHLFHGFVNVLALCLMGNPDADYCLPEVRGFTPEHGIALLDRAAEIGHIAALGGGSYSIHPALPWFFTKLFDKHYAGSETRATRAFVKGMGELGNDYHNQYGAGNRNVIAQLAAEEANLLYARRLAREHGWWNDVIGTMQGLAELYDHTGRRAEWARLIEEIVPDFVDPATDGPLPDREDLWGIVTGYRVRLASGRRHWAEAERLQRRRMDRQRERAATALALPLDKLDGASRNSIRSLAACLHQLGEVQREQGQPQCVKAYRESLDLSERIGEQSGAAICALALGNAYEALPELSNLDEAERWYRRSLDLRTETDRLGRSKSHGGLGIVARARFRAARAAGKPETELLRHVNEAARAHHTALDLLPPTAAHDLAVVHHQLGAVYVDAGDLDRALPHFREAVRAFESAGAPYNAATARRSVAVALTRARRFSDALEYARAALHNYEAYGDRAQKELQEMYQLIARIEGAQKSAQGA